MRKDLEKIRTMIADAHIWLFYGFLLSATLSIRKILIFYPIKGAFNEYLSISLYLSDIFAVGVIILWIYNNKISNLSRKRLFDGKKMFHVEHRILSGKGMLIYVPLIIIGMSFLSILWSENIQIALYRSLKIFEFYLIYLFVLKNVPRGTFYVRTLQLVVFSGLLNSAIAIWQFIVQKSIGLRFLRESLISREMPGVAKIVVVGEKVMRAYGLFPHPNILAGFIFFSVIATLILKNSALSKGKSAFLYNSLLFIQLAGLLVSFSRSAIVGLFLAIFYVLFIRNKRFEFKQMNKLVTTPHFVRKMFHHIKNVPRGTFVAGVEHLFVGRKVLSINCEPFYAYLKKILIVGSIVFILMLFGKFQSNPIQSIRERGFYINIASDMIYESPIIGHGIGQFVVSMDRFNGGLEEWMFQPVHNVFMLFFVEMGVFGVILLVLFLFKLFNSGRATVKHEKSELKCSTWNNNICKIYDADNKENVPRGTFNQYCDSIILNGFLIGLIFIMFFDHYLWDIQQGQVIFWLSLGLIAGNKRRKQ